LIWVERFDFNRDGLVHLTEAAEYVQVVTLVLFYYWLSLYYNT